MNLDKISTADLLEEVEKRKELEKESEMILCMGIIDDLGAESFIRVDTAAKFSEKLTPMLLRSRYASHRNAYVYSVRLNVLVVEMIEQMFKKITVDHVEISTMLKRLGLTKLS